MKTRLILAAGGGAGFFRVRVRRRLRDAIYRQRVRDRGVGFEEGQRLRDHAAVVDHDEGTLAAARRALPRARSAPPRREV